MGWLSKVFSPPRYRFLAKAFPQGQFQVLDVGCGEHSFATFKHHFPHASYHGLDQHRPRQPTTFIAPDQFFPLNLETDSFASVPDLSYDAIIFSHTIEHLLNGHEVVAKLVPKLKIGGLFYLELPSVRSLSLPSADGTLNFFDDPTHVRVYDLKELVNTLLAHNVRVLRLGKARSFWKMILVTPLAAVYGVYYWARYRRFSAKGWLEITGFADFILGKRHDIPRTSRLGNWRETLARHANPLLTE